MQYVTNRPPRYRAIRVEADNAEAIAEFIGPDDHRPATPCEVAQIFDRNVSDWRPLTEGLWLVDTPIFIFVLTQDEFDSQFQTA